MRQLEVRGGLEVEEIEIGHGNTKLSGQSGATPSTSGHYWKYPRQFDIWVFGDWV